MSAPSVLKAIIEQFGKGSIALASEAAAVINFQKIKTCIFALDVVLKGGLPKSGIVEFYGKESAMKTTCALLIMAILTNLKKYVAIVDIEGSITADYLERLHINMEYCYIVRPKVLEEALDITEALVASKEFSIVLFDSIGAVISKQEMDKSSFENSMAVVANKLTRHIGAVQAYLQPEDLTDPLSRNDTTVIYINQIRDSLEQYGEKDRTRGGHAVKHGALVRLKFHPAEKLKEKNEVIGRQFKVSVVKSKVSDPFKSVTFKYYYKTGKIDNAESLISIGCLLGVIKQSGAFYTYGEIEHIKGKEAFILALNEKPEVFQSLKDSILNSNLNELNDDSVKEDAVEEGTEDTHE